MLATKMRGGLGGGVLAAFVTLCAIFGARYVIVQNEVGEHLKVDDAAAIEALSYEVAEEWAEQDIQVLDEYGDYVPAVMETAHLRWEAMEESERQSRLAALTTEQEQIGEVLTPIALLFDFGIFGTICAALAAGAAFKTGSISLEDALQQQGEAPDAATAAKVAAQMRRDDSRQGAAAEPESAVGGGFFRYLPAQVTPPAQETAAADEGGSASHGGGAEAPEKREAA